jgi:hypothetical protein
MIQLRLFGRCAIYHDPVTPVLKAPAAIGWKANYREIDLVIERRLKGEELLRRMKGWFTIDPEEIIEAVRPFGKLKVTRDGDLVMELADEAQTLALTQVLKDRFQDQVLLQP